METVEMSSAARDVLAERERQKAGEGWTAEHDDKHDHGEIAYAAACYALAGTDLGLKEWLRDIVERLWPWDRKWWKPTQRRRSLVKAGALILAEIERLDRVNGAGGLGGGVCEAVFDTFAEAIHAARLETRS